MKYELLRCGVDINKDPIQEILVTRGIPCMEIPNYLYTTDTDITPPEMLSNIVEGARLLLSYIDKNEKALLIRLIKLLIGSLAKSTNAPKTLPKIPHFSM